MRTVILTRPRAGSPELASALTRAGLTVHHLPTLELSDTINPADDSHLRSHWQQYRGMVLVSQYAAQFAHQHLTRLGLTLAPDVWLGAVGQGTVHTLRERWSSHPLIIAPSLNDTQDSEGLWRAIEAYAPIQPNTPPQRILIARAQSGRDVLRQLLAQAGAQVDIWACYHRNMVDWTATEQRIFTQTIQSPADTLIIITSIEGLNALMAQFPTTDARQAQMRRTTLLTIHPRIAEFAQAQGFANTDWCAPSTLTEHAINWARMI